MVVHDSNPNTGRIRNSKSSLAIYLESSLGYTKILYQNNKNPKEWIGESVRVWPGCPVVVQVWVLGHSVLWAFQGCGRTP